MKELNYSQFEGFTKTIIIFSFIGPIMPAVYFIVKEMLRGEIAILLYFLLTFPAAIAIGLFPGMIAGLAFAMIFFGASSSPLTVLVRIPFSGFIIGGLLGMGVLSAFYSNLSTLGNIVGGLCGIISKNVCFGVENFRGKGVFHRLYSLMKNM